MTRIVTLITLLVLPLFSALAGSTPIIDTVAGGGGPNNVPAATANLKQVSGMVIGPSGDLFIAVPGGHRVYRIDATGLLVAVAGTGAPSTGGDGGPATSAALSAPGGLAFDAAGNLFISTGQYIRRVDAVTGIITTVAGNGTWGTEGDGGPALQASFKSPSGLAFDAIGDLYILDSGALQVRRLNMSTSIITRYAGGGNNTGDGWPATLTYFLYPTDIAFDASGNLLVAQSGRVRVVDRQSGIVSTVAGTGIRGTTGDGGPATLARLDDPSGLAVDPGGNLFIADRAGHRVRRVGVNGIITTVAGTGSTDFSGDGGPAVEAGLSAWEVTVNGTGDLFIGDWINLRIRRVSGVTAVIDTYAGTGDCCFFGEEVPARQAELNQPLDMAVDQSGNIFVLDNGNARLRKVDHASGLIQTIAGNGADAYSGDDGPGAAAAINIRYGGGVTVDASGNALIADAGNFRVRRVDAVTGIITTVAGNGSAVYNGDGIPATEAGMAPVAVAIDPSGNLLLLDSWSRRVRRVDALTGLIQTVAGNSLAGPGGDGGLAVASSLSYPNDIAVDRQGNLFIAEGGYNDEMDGLIGSNRIRRVDAVTGILTTVAHAFIPLSVAVDGAGNIFFSVSFDYERGDIRGGVLGVDSQTGIVHRVTGPGDYSVPCGLSGDGGPAVDSPVCFAAGVNVDMGGNLFIADWGSNRIRRVRMGNAAPVADAGGDIIAACDAPGGAGVTLDGSASFDPDSKPGTDDDIASWEWFEDLGLPGGSSLGTGQTLNVSLPSGSHAITLEVTDLAGVTATDDMLVIVQEAAPAGLSIIFDPALLWPPNHRLADVTATVLTSNQCSTPPSSTLLSVTSSEPDDAPGSSDGATTDDIQDVSPGTADFTFRLRAERDAEGPGRVYTATYLVSNSVGAAMVSADLIVPHDRAGLTDPIELSLTGTPAGTILAWESVPGANHYNVIRGDLSGIKLLGNGVDLRSAVCLASRLLVAGTQAHEDPTMPAPGRVLYYLVEYDDGSPSGYGTAEAEKPLQVPAGICP